MQQHPGEVPQRGLGLLGGLRVVAAAHPGDFGLQGVADLGAQRGHRGTDRDRIVGVSCRRVTHQRLCVVGDRQVLQRCVQLDRRQVEQGHPRQVGNQRVDVSGQAQVDDDPLPGMRLGLPDRALCGGAAGHRAGSVQQPGAEHDVGAHRAADDHVDPCDGRGDRMTRGQVQAVPQGELVATSGRRPDGDVGDAAVTQRLQARGGVASGADQQHPGAAPVGDAMRGQIEGQPDQRRPCGTQAGAAAYGAAGLEGVGEHPLQHRTCACCASGLVERPPHLAGDLRLADDHRFEPGGHPEEMPGGLLALQQHQVTAQLLDGGQGVRFDVEIDLEPVAGAQHDFAGDPVAGQQLLGKGRSRRRREPFQNGEVVGAVACGQAQQHRVSIVPL